MKVCWVDVETTGTDPATHGIWQVAFLIEIDKVIAERTQFTMNPVDSEIDPALIQNHMLDEKLVRAFKLTDRDTMPMIRAVLQKYVDPYDRADKFTPAGYNVKFDLDFLEALWLRCGDKYFYSYFSHFPVDVLYLTTVAVWMGKIPVPANRQLGTIVTECHISTEGSRLHDAMSDVNLTYKLAQHLKRVVSPPRRMLLEKRLFFARVRCDDPDTPVDYRLMTLEEALVENQSLTDPEEAWVEMEIEQ